MEFPALGLLAEFGLKPTEILILFMLFQNIKNTRDILDKLADEVWRLKKDLSRKVLEAMTIKAIALLLLLFGVFAYAKRRATIDNDYPIDNFPPPNANQPSFDVGELADHIG